MLTICAAALVIVADQASKLWIRRAFAEEESLVVVRNFLNITFIRNRGGAFGIFPQQQYLFLVLSIVTVVALALLYRRFAPRGRSCRAAVGMIVGGAVGNLVDRVLVDRNGCVIDWLDLHLGQYHWPAFNIADMAISTGVAILIYLLVVRAEVPSGSDSTRA
jgi:signal peptidase II